MGIQRHQELEKSKPAKEAKKSTTTTVINAFIIGFAIGIVIYSIFNNTVGIVTLLPLYIIYRAVNGKKGPE